MISYERRFRRDYHEYRNEERGRNSSGDMNYSDAADQQGYDRQYDRSTGYNHSRDYGNRIYERRNTPGRGRYYIQDYDYNRENAETYGREAGSSEDFWRSRYDTEQGFSQNRKRNSGYLSADDNDQSSRNRKPQMSGESYGPNRSTRGERNDWENNPYDSGMGRYQARDRSENFYGGRTEFPDSRSYNQSRDQDRGSFERNRNRNRHSHDSYYGRYDRDRY